MIKRVAWPDGASTGRLQLVSGTLGLAEGSGAHSLNASQESSPETVELLDLSDPANPRTVQSFSGVTGVLTDEGRGLIYLTNPEGLWIVKSRPEKYSLRRQGDRANDYDVPEGVPRFHNSGIASHPA